MSSRRGSTAHKKTPAPMLGFRLVAGTEQKVTSNLAERIYFYSYKCYINLKLLFRTDGCQYIV